MTAAAATYGAVLYKAAAHLHNMGDSDTATRVMATCARLQYTTAPQPNIMCALGSIVAAQGLQRDLVAHAPSPVVFAHGLHALRAAASFGIKQAVGSSTAPAPNILAMTLKQFGSAARCVCGGCGCELLIHERCDAPQVAGGTGARVFYRTVGRAMRLQRAQLRLCAAQCSRVCRCVRQHDG